MEIVLVDNGSLDDVADRAGYPQVRLLEPLANLGFAGGCNLGMWLAGDHDFVALVNNDATVEPGWLRPLVAAAQPAADIGAVSAKMLFAHRYLGIEVAVPGVPTINRNDPRDLGVRLGGTHRRRASRPPGVVRRGFLRSGVAQLGVRRGDRAGAASRVHPHRRRHRATAAAGGVAAAQQPRTANGDAHHRCRAAHTAGGRGAHLVPHPARRRAVRCDQQRGVQPLPRRVRRRPGLPRSRPGPVPVAGGRCSCGGARCC